MQKLQTIRKSNQLMDSNQWHRYQSKVFYQELLLMKIPSIDLLRELNCIVKDKMEY